MYHIRLSGIIDKNEAPEGYYAVEKDSLGTFEIVGNYCRHCDFRPHCVAGNSKVRCMQEPAIRHDGSIWERKDGCSVVFKRVSASIR